MKKIFIFAIPNNEKNSFKSFALCEDGYIVASCLSTSKEWAKHDMGVTSNWKHKQYKEYCPDGFNLIWVDFNDINNNEAFKKAFELNQIIYGKKK